MRYAGRLIFFIFDGNGTGKNGFLGGFKRGLS